MDHQGGSVCIPPPAMTGNTSVRNQTIGTHTARTIGWGAQLCRRVTGETDLFLQSDELFLQFVTKRRETVPYVVGQLLIQDTLQVGSAQSVGHVPENRDTSSSRNRSEDTSNNH